MDIVVNQSSKFSDTYGCERPCCGVDLALFQLFSLFSSDFGYRSLKTYEEMKIPEKWYLQLKEIRKAIAEMKKAFESKIILLSNFCVLNQDLEAALPFCHLELIESGVSGAYLLKEEEEIPQFVIKPMDEGMFAINNPKGRAEFRLDRGMRDSVPPYKTAETDYMAYLLATEIGIGEVTPETTMALLNLEGFFDISFGAKGEQLKELIEFGGAPDLQKLCSVQRFVPGALPLFELLHKFQREGLSDKEIAEKFDQENFERLNLFLWLIFETDGHFGNFLAVPKDEGKWSLVKIDNSLSFPKKNTEFRNSLKYLENSNERLSSKAKEMIKNIPIDKIVEHLTLLNMDYAIPAFIERVSVLRWHAGQEGVTIKQINEIIY
ncbi:MAG: hypothetical protein KAR79_00090 [Simkaniaceae bacterium]|nr:hypothetical protein [Simkaniaceae bacterium]